LPATGPVPARSRVQFCFSGARLRAIKLVMSRTEPAPVEHYPLSGGGTVAIHRPFGAATYMVMVSLDGGGYPAEGSIACNCGRQEYAVVLTGHLTFEVNGESYERGPGESMLLAAGVPYRICGAGTSAVLVTDEPGARTELRPITP